MKNIILGIAALFLTTDPSFAALNMKPGLWEIKTKINSGSGETDPMAQMRKSMDQMSPEQRKQMEAAMAKQGMSPSGNGAKVCYTPELLKNNESVMNQKDSKCKSNVTQKTAKKTAVEFNCENGSKGTGEWNFVSDKQYSGTVKVTDAKGALSQIHHDARFVSNDCGDVKPLKLSP